VGAFYNVVQQHNLGDVANCQIEYHICVQIIDNNSERINEVELYVSQSYAVFLAHSVDPVHFYTNAAESKMLT